MQFITLFVVCIADGACGVHKILLFPACRRWKGKNAKLHLISSECKRSQKHNGTAFMSARWRRQSRSSHFHFAWFHWNAGTGCRLDLIYLVAAAHAGALRYSYYFAAKRPAPGQQHKIPFLFEFIIYFVTRRLRNVVLFVRRNYDAVETTQSND